MKRMLFVQEKKHVRIGQQQADYIKYSCIAWYRCFKRKIENTYTVVGKINSPEDKEETTFLVLRGLE